MFIHFQLSHRVAVDGSKVNDIRGFYQYKFVATEGGQILMILKKNTQSSKKFVINLSSKSQHQATVPSHPKDYLYGTWENDEYQIEKQSITAEKAEDIWKLSYNCVHLTQEERNWYYPLPRNDEDETNNNCSENQNEDQPDGPTDVAKKLSCWCTTSEEQEQIFEALNRPIQLEFPKNFASFKKYSNKLL